MQTVLNPPCVLTPTLTPTPPLTHFVRSSTETQSNETRNETRPVPACLGDDDVLLQVVKVGVQAPWLAAQRSTRACLGEATGAGVRERASVCLGADVLTTVILCVYGDEASQVQ